MPEKLAETMCDNARRTRISQFNDAERVRRTQV